MLINIVYEIIIILVFIVIIFYLYLFVIISISIILLILLSSLFMEINNLNVYYVFIHDYLYL